MMILLQSNYNNDPSQLTNAPYIVLPPTCLTNGPYLINLIVIESFL